MNTRTLLPLTALGALLLTGCGATPTVRAVLPASGGVNDAARAPLPTPTLVPTWTPVDPTATPASIDLLVGPLPMPTPTLPQRDSTPVQATGSDSAPPAIVAPVSVDYQAAPSLDDSTSAENGAKPASNDSTSAGNDAKPNKPSATDRQPGKAEPKPPKPSPKPPKAHPAPGNDGKGSQPRERGGEKGPDDKGRGGKRGG